MSDISRALKFAWDAKFLKVRGELRLDDGNINGVLHDADAMLKLDAENAWAMALRGAAYVRRKDYGNALAEFDKASRPKLAASRISPALGQRVLPSSKNMRRPMCTIAIRVDAQPRRTQPLSVRQRDPRFTEIWIDRR